MSEEKSNSPLSFKDAVQASISEKHIENKNDKVIVKKTDDDDSLPTFEDIKEITEKAKDKFNNATKEFINDLEKDSANIKRKIISAASRNYTRVNFYIWQWTDDKNATHDSRGNKIIYGENIHLSTLITKDYENFIEQLNKFFNKDGTDKLKCGLFIKKRDENNSFNIYHLYVSWGYENKEFTPGYKRVSNK
jgi:hypothetical protein